LSEEFKIDNNSIITDTNSTTKIKLIRGFAAMSKEQRTAIARKGGAAVPAHKRSFSQDAELASKAGRKGGERGHGGGRPKKVLDND
jgi:general stress protein YciG